MVTRSRPRKPGSEAQFFPKEAALKSARRTSDQTEIARFWIITGPQSFDPIVRQLAAAPGRSLMQNARLFALVEMAVADSYIAVFDAKYTFNFWRPITAIRNGDIDGNDATARDPAWEPLVDTPLHPEYPCAHCINSAAARAVLESEFGTGPIPLTMTSASAPGVVHKWQPSGNTPKRFHPPESTAGFTTGIPLSWAWPWAKRSGTGQYRTT